MRFKFYFFLLKFGGILKGDHLKQADLDLHCFPKIAQNIVKKVMCSVHLLGCTIIRRIIL